MANNKTVLQFEGRLDPSQILKSLQQIRNTMKTAGVKDSLFKGVDKELENAAKLLTEFKAQVSNGIGNQKDIQALNKAFERLDKSLSKISTGFKEIANDASNFNVSTGQITTLTKQLEQLSKAKEKAQNKIKSSVQGAIDNIGMSQSSRNEILKEIEDYNKLEEAIKNVAKAREDRFKRIMQKHVATNSAAMQTASGISISSFNNPHQGADAQSYQQLVQSSYQTAMKSALANGQNLQATFERIVTVLQSANVEITDMDSLLEEVRRDYTDIINSAYATSSNQVKGSITKALAQNQQLGYTNSSGEMILNDTGQSLLPDRSQFQEISNIQQQIAETQEQYRHITENTAQANESAAQNTVNALESIRDAQDNVGEGYREVSQSAEEAIKNQDDLNQTFDNMKESIKQFLSISAAITQVKQMFKETYEDVKKIDSAFGSIAMVTDKTVGELWSSYNKYANIANELGQSTENAIKSSALFYQQGLKTEEVFSLTESTMKLATLSEQDFETATKQMTAALRGFNMEMEQGTHITDVYSELAASAAADVHGIAYAMSKTASIANSAGMSFENTAAFLTNMIETTQEAPENIGTAMKTIIARFTELKENIAGTTDSEFDDLDYNKVDKALKSVNISLKDSAGQFRNLDDVFLELSAKWGELDRNTQRYIATIAAGSRQQSRFIAMMEDYDRTMELIETAQDSAGKSEEQFAKKADTLEYKITVLKNTFEQLRISLMNQDLFKNLIDSANNFLVKISKLDLKKALITAVAITPIVKSFVSNFTDGLKRSVNSFAQAGKTISQNIAQSIPNIPLLKNMYNSDNLEIDKLKLRLQELQNIDIEVRTSAENAEMEQILGQLDAIEQKSKVVASGIQYTFQSLTSGIAIMLSGGEIEDAINTMSVQMLASFANMGLEMLAQVVANWAAANAATTAGGATMAATAGAAGTAAGTALSAGFAATGVGAIVVGIGLVLGAVGLAVAKVVKDNKANNLTLEEQLDLYKDINKEAQENSNQAKNRANEAKEEYKTIEELKQEYERLNVIKEKTQTQEEEYKEIVKQIKEQIPEIVTYYDETTGQLEVQLDYWESILEAAKELSELENKKASAAQAVATATNYQEQKKDYEIQTEKLKTKEEDIGDFGHYMAGLIKYKFEQQDTNEITEDEIINNLEDAQVKMDVNTSMIETINLLKDKYAENIISEEELEDEIIEVTKVMSGLNTSFETLDNKTKQLEKSFDTLNEKNISENLKREDGKYSDTVNNILAKAAYGKYEKREIATETRTTDDPISLFDLEIAQLINENYTSQEALWKLNEKEFENFVGQYNNAYINRALTDWAKSIELSDFDQKIIEDAVAKQADYTDSSLKQAKKQENNLPEEIRVAYEEALTEIQEERTSIKNNISALIGEDASKFSSYTTNELRAVQNVIGDFEKEIGEGEAKYFTKEALNIKERFKLTSEEFSDIMSMDFSSVDLSNIDKFVENMKDKLSCDEDKKDKIVNSWIEVAKTVGAINLGTTANGIEEIINKMSETFSNKLEAQGNISKIISSQLENGFISFSESKTLTDALKKVNMNVDNYLRTNINGELFLDINKLKDGFLENSKIFDDLIAQAKEENNRMIDQLETELAILEINEGKINLNNLQISQEYEKYKIVAEILKLEGKLVGNNGLYELNNDYFIDTEKLNKEKQQVINRIDTYKNANKEIDKNMEDLEKKFYSQLNSYNIEIDKSFNELSTSAKEELNKIKDAQDEVIEAQKKLNEALYGTETHKDALDLLYNYNINLERMKEKAEKAKEALEDLNSIGDKSQLINDYLTGTHGEIVNREAENRVLQQSIANRKAVLDEKLNQAISRINANGEGRNLSNNISDYYTIVGDRLNVNHAAIDNALLPDDLKDYIHEQISTINEEYDQIEENRDAIQKKEKEFFEVQKNIREKYINLEQEVINTLKEKYEEEIQNNEDKNKALEEADNKYLEALKNNIEKQKKLREENNSMEELAEKQKKLTLMQSDTSGANEKDVKKLEEEVEKAQQTNLDNKINNILEGLQEFYELQKESRELEIEYQKTMIDNTQIIKEANELISSWNAPEDMIEWMMNNQKDLSEKTQAQIDSERESWEEMFNAKELYMVSSGTDFSEALKIQEDEITETIKNTSEVLTSEADRALAEIEKNVNDAITEAEKSLKDAMISLAEAQNGKDGDGSNYKPILPPDTTTGDRASNSNLLGSHPNTPDWGKAEDDADKAFWTNYNYILSNRNLTERTTKLLELLSSFEVKDSKLQTKIATQVGTNIKEDAFIDKIYKALELNPWLNITSISHNPNAPGYYLTKKKYAQGGLVDYTGPAWVDGTKSKPEAFLSSEDTERIGAAAKLLATIPQLMHNNTNTTSSNIGDTSIEIHINVESLGNDYDVDRLAERIKQDIVNISKPVGTPILLNK